MQAFNKLWAALAGAIAAIVVDLAQKHLGMDLSPHMDSIVNAIITGGTALAVYLVPNKSGNVSSGISGGAAAMLLCAILSLPLLGGCPAVTGGAVHSKPSTEAPAVAGARIAIDEANAALTALNNVIGQNAVDGVWTKAQAQGYLDKSKGYGKQADQARELLRAGDPLKAENQAKLLRQAILVLHKEVAAQARGKP